MADQKLERGEGGGLKQEHDRMNTEHRVTPFAILESIYHK
jgi:hypothetical protein